MQGLMRFVHRLYIGRLGRELKEVQLAHRVHTQDIKQLRALHQRVQSDTRNNYPPHMITQIATQLERYEAVIATEADSIKELQAEIKAEKKKRASS